MNDQANETPAAKQARLLRAELPSRITEENLARLQEALNSAMGKVAITRGTSLKKEAEFIEAKREHEVAARDAALLEQRLAEAITRFHEQRAEALGIAQPKSKVIVEPAPSIATASLSVVNGDQTHGIKVEVDKAKGEGSITGSGIFAPRPQPALSDAERAKAIDNAVRAIENGASKPEAVQFGDVVRRKSGGPEMTVKKVEVDGTVLCVWQEHGGDSQSYFYAASLELIRRADPAQGKTERLKIDDVGDQASAGKGSFVDPATGVTTTGEVAPEKPQQLFPDYVRHLGELSRADFEAAEFTGETHEKAGFMHSVWKLPSGELVLNDRDSDR